MVSALQKRADDLRCGIVGIGDHDAWLRNAEILEEKYELVHEGALVTVGEGHPFMDAACQRESEEALCCLDHDSDGLAGVAEDILRLGVVLRFLVELLDRRHFATGFGSFDAIGEQHDAPVDGEEERLKNAENQARPQGGELCYVNCWAVKEIQEAVVECTVEPESPHKTCDAPQILTHTESGQRSGEPKEGAVAAKGGTQ